jgi:hypothetical protein
MPVGRRFSRTAIAARLKGFIEAQLVDALMPKGYDATAERAILFSVKAWDENCPQHIPQRFEATI